MGDSVLVGCNVELPFAEGFPLPAPEFEALLFLPLPLTLAIGGGGEECLTFLAYIRNFGVRRW